MPQYYCHNCRASFDIDESAQIACTRCHGEFVEIVNRPAMMAAAMPQGFGQMAFGHIADLLRTGIAAEIRGAQQQHAAPQQQQPQGAPQEPETPQAEQPQPRAAAGGREQQHTLEEFIRNMFRPDPRGAAEEAASAQQQQQQPHPNVTFSFQMPGGIGVQIHAHTAGGGGGNNPDGMPFGMEIGERADLESAMQEILAQFQAAGGEGGQRQGGFTEAEVKEYLPMKKVTQEHIDNGAQCTTCFDTFKLDEDVGALDCNHIFHRPCIEPWLKTKNSCPVCRQKVNMKEWKKNHLKKLQEADLDSLDQKQ